MSCSLLRKLKILQNENSISGDLIQKSFNDSYRALTTKVLEILRWYVDSSEKIPHLMKTDDDMYINVKNAHEVALSKHNMDGLTGLLICKSFPHRDPKSKWHMPKSLYPEKIYPPFLSGTAYLMSRYTFRYISTFLYLNDHHKRL